MCLFIWKWSNKECVLCGFFWNIDHRGNRIVIQHSLKLSTRYTATGASWEMQDQPPSVPCLGPPDTSYRVIFRWLLLVWDLKVPRRGHDASQATFLIVPGPGSLSKRHRSFRERLLLIWEIVEKAESWGIRDHLYGKATVHGLDGPTNWVEQCIKESARLS